MQQNMARHKSVLGYVHKPRQPKPARPSKPLPPADKATDKVEGT